jgi:hypothetical protein
MKITEVLAYRKHPKVNARLTDDVVVIHDIGVKVKLPAGWLQLDKNEINTFFDDYVLPESAEEYGGTKKGELRKAFYPPTILISNRLESRQLIAFYVFDRAGMTGTSLFHVRSLVKFEIGWLGCLIEFLPRDKPYTTKKLTIGDFNASISSLLPFQYRTLSNHGPINSRLRILMIEKGDIILAFYFIDTDDQPLLDTDLEKFIDQILVN